MDLKGWRGRETLPLLLRLCGSGFFQRHISLATPGSPLDLRAWRRLWLQSSKWWLLLTGQGNKTAIFLLRLLIFRNDQLWSSHFGEWSVCLSTCAWCYFSMADSDLEVTHFYLMVPTTLSILVHVRKKPKHFLMNVSYHDLVRNSVRILLFLKVIYYFRQWFYACLHACVTLACLVFSQAREDIRSLRSFRWLSMAKWGAGN